MRGKRLWSGHPSQAINRTTFTVCALTFWLGVPAIYAWRKYRQTQQALYEVTDFAVSAVYPNNGSANRLMELYRIEAMEIETPNHLAKHGLSNLLIRTKNPNIPPIVFEAISDAASVKAKIESVIEESRKKQKIQEIQIPILQS